MTARCQVCRNCGAKLTTRWLPQFDIYIADRNDKLGCSPECADAIAAYVNHRASRENDWPATDEWSAFAALVADWEMIVDLRVSSGIAWEHLRWRRRTNPLFHEFWSGFFFGKGNTPAARLGRLIAERRRAGR